jgi:hypothetical protein
MLISTRISSPESVNPNGATSSTNANATAGPSNAAFHFGGDAEDEEDEEEGEGEGEGEDGEEEEKEDDFEAAFVALDMARRIIEVEVEKLEREMKEVKAEDGAKEGKEAKEKEKVVRQEKLAEIHRLLGDVSTESGTLRLSRTISRTIAWSLTSTMPCRTFRRSR